jgi:hypothetical protein
LILEATQTAEQLYLPYHKSCKQLDTVSYLMCRTKQSSVRQPDLQSNLIRLQQYSKQLDLQRNLIRHTPKSSPQLNLQAKTRGSANA